MIKSLKIGPSKYKVIYKPLGSYWGYTCSEKKEIVISSYAEPKRRAITLFHEALHAIGAEYGVTASMEDDEWLVRIFEVSIHGLILENKAFAKELIKEMGEHKSGK